MKAGELIPTLTGFEELAIEQACGKPLEEIVDTGTLVAPKAARDILLARVLGAVLISREEKIAYPAAWQKALGMTQKELGDLFPDEDEEDEVFEAEPVTESGKDDSGSESAPTSSPSSVSSAV